jgi:hypothetical protein
MGAASAVAFTSIRVTRGAPRPTEEQFQEALRRDRERLHHPPRRTASDIQTAGPYHIQVDGAELDEYVVWER